MTLEKTITTLHRHFSKIYNKVNNLWCKIFFIVILVILSALIEVFVFNWNSIFIDDSSKGIQDIDISKLTEYNQLNIQNKLLYSEEPISELPWFKINSEDHIIYLNLTTYDTSPDFYINILSTDKTVISEKLYILGYGKNNSFKVNSLAHKTIFQIEPINNQNAVSISKISINNDFVFNISRFIALLSLGILLLFFFYYYKYAIAHPQSMFFIMVLLIGISSAINTHPGMIFDEEQHFVRSYQIANGDFSLQEGNKQIYIPENFHDISRIHAFSYIDYTNVKNDFLNTEINIKTEVGTTSTYLFAPYLPYSIGIFIGKIINLPFWHIYYLGRFTGLLFYALVGSLLIKHTPIGKLSLFSIMLYPSIIYSSSGYTSDMMTFICTISCFVLFFNMLSQKEKNISNMKIILFFLACLLNLMGKMTYIPICILFLVIPNNKFKTKPKITILLKILMVLFNIVFAYISYSYANFRGLNSWQIPNVDANLQMSYIINNIGSFIKVVSNQVSDNLWNMFSNNVTGLAYYGNLKVIWSVILFITFVLLPIAEKNRYRLRFIDKITIIIGIVATWFAIVAALYVGFTPVGSLTVNGVQGRYFGPLLFGSSMLLVTPKIKSNFNQKNLTTFVYLIMITINISFISHILFKFNWS